MKSWYDREKHHDFLHGSLHGREGVRRRGDCLCYHRSLDGLAQVVEEEPQLLVAEGEVVRI
jgi:hypothetical protein